VSLRIAALSLERNPKKSIDHIDEIRSSVLILRVFLSIERFRSIGKRASLRAASARLQSKAAARAPRAVAIKEVHAGQDNGRGADREQKDGVVVILSQTAARRPLPRAEALATLTKILAMRLRRGGWTP
jgi:hypothetical protein